MTNCTTKTKNQNEKNQTKVKTKDFMTEKAEQKINM